jgi:hypothetical protein
LQFIRRYQAKRFSRTGESFRPLTLADRTRAFSPASIRIKEAGAGIILLQIPF